MPNIEIHGLDSDDAEKIEDRIRVLFITGSYDGGVVVTTAFDSCRDLKSREFPFLRVYNTRDEKNEEILRTLKREFGTELDIEFQILEAFYPRE